MVDVEKTEVRQAPPKTQHVDGGSKAWLQVVGSFCIFFNTWGIVNTYGAYQTYYQSTLFSSRSPSDISWIGSFQIFGILFGALFVGPLFDRGYLKTLVQLGSFLLAFGMMMTSLCTEYWQAFLAQGIVVGLGVGCLFLPSIAVIMHYFRRKKALATGIVAAGGSIGGVIYPIIFRELEHKPGFGWATRTIAFVCIATLIPPLVIMEVELPPSATKRTFFDRTVLTDAPYIWFCTGQFFGFMSIYITYYYIQLYALEQASTSSDLAASFIPIISGASTVGRLVPNAFADKFGSLNLLIPLSFATAALVFGWIGIHDSGGLVAFAVLYGFFQGPFVSLPATIVATLTPDMSKIGVRMGMMLAASGLGSLVGEPIAGAILNGSGGWVGLQAWCAALFVMSGLCSSITKLLLLRAAKRSTAPSI